MTQDRSAPSRGRFFDLSLDLLCVATVEGYFEELNPMWERVLGWSMEELQAEPFVAFIHPDDVEATIQETAALREGVETVLFENRYRCKDGSYRWLRWTASYDDSRYWAVARDVTDEKAAAVLLAESEGRFRRAFEQGPIPMMLLDSDLRIAEANDALCLLVRRRETDVVGDVISSILVPEDEPVERERLLTVLRLGQTTREEIGLQRSSGEILWARATASRTGVNADRLILVLEDISDRREAEDALGLANDKLERWVTELEVRNRHISLMNELGDMLQSSRSIEEVSSVLTMFARRLFPMEVGAIGLMSEGRQAIEVVSSWGDEQHSSTLFAPDDCWALRRGRLHEVDDRSISMTCSHLGDVEGSMCIPLMAQGEALGLLTLVASQTPGFVRKRDPKDRRQLAASFAEHISLALANFRLRETLREQSIRDPLTGLFNRRYLDETLDRELLRAERSGTQVAVLAADIDFFKTVNDEYGHEAGDLVLQEIANVLAGSVRGQDLACRLGGEEFAVILTSGGDTIAPKRAEAIREAVEQIAIRYRGVPMKPITLSSESPSTRRMHPIARA